ncbi:hypothetical protein EXVG_00178 [Emiliania huxleyi virus 202]|nr:hypothetical protein EXVG_00178 [Emiliania huxleyi virus 202]
MATVPSMWMVTVTRECRDCYSEETFYRYITAVVLATSEADASARFIAKNAPMSNYEIVTVPYTVGDWVEIYTGVDDESCPF